MVTTWPKKSQAWAWPLDTDPMKPRTPLYDSTSEGEGEGAHWDSSSTSSTHWVAFADTDKKNLLIIYMRRTLM